MSTYPANATIKFGEGRTGGVCHAADITAGAAGVRGLFAASVLDSDIPALLSKGALETLLGCLDFARHTRTLGTNGRVTPLQMSDVGHYILSVADFPRPSFSASLFHWDPMNRETQLLDEMRNGGLRLDDASQVNSRSALANFAPSQLFSECKAVTLRDAGNAEISGPKTIIMKLHINWGRASATQITRVLVDTDGDTQPPIRHAGDVVSQRDTCKASEKAPHIPISGTSSVSMFSDRLQMDLLFLDVIITLRIMDVFSKYSILARVRSKNPQEV